MRIAVADPYGYGISWPMRMHDEGHEVRVWIKPPTQKRVGDGLVEKAGTFDDLVQWVREGKDPLVLFAGSGLGDQAERVRRLGIPVVCGGEFMDRLEQDRTFGQKIAKDAGCLLPPYQEYASIAECRQACEGIGHGVFFKTDRYMDADTTHGAKNGKLMAEYLDGLIDEYGGHGKCILQKKIDGVPLSTARWWNGMTWVGPYQGTYENKKFMNDDVGPATGCSLNAMWFYGDDPVIADLLKWDELTAAFRTHRAPPGLYDINAIITESGEAYFLEWTPRLGYDSEMTSAYLIPNLAEHLYAVATGGEVEEPSDELAYGVRVTVPPYPEEYVDAGTKASPDGTRINGHLDKHFVPYCVRLEKDHTVIAGPEGQVGLAVAVGDRLSKLHDEVIDYLKEDLRVPGAMYRTDGGKDIKQAALKLVEAGIDLPTGLYT